MQTLLPLFVLLPLLFQCTPRKKNRERDTWGECLSNVECGGAQICVANKCVAPPQGTEIQKSAPRGMVYVPAGAFWMGNNQGTALERPQTRSVTGEFFIERTEVSYGAYKGCVDRGVCPPPSCAVAQHPRLPAVCITHEGARRYCAERGMRLPTQEEWEKAARGEKAHRYPWGEAVPTCERANFAACKRGLAPVDAYEKGASVYGTLQQSGNIWEWTATRQLPWNPGTDPKKQRAGYGEKRQLAPAKLERRGTRSRDHYIVRGGSHLDPPAAMRASIVQLLPEDFFSPLLGFRCVRDVEQ